MREWSDGKTGFRRIRFHRKERERMPRKSIAPEARETFLRLHAQGWSERRIAFAYGLSAGTVHAVLTGRANISRERWEGTGRPPDGRPYRGLLRQAVNPAATPEERREAASRVRDASRRYGARWLGDLVTGVFGGGNEAGRIEVILQGGELATVLPASLEDAWRMIAWASEVKSRNWADVDRLASQPVTVISPDGRRVRVRLASSAEVQAMLLRGELQPEDTLRLGDPNTPGLRRKRTAA
jgi:hypothetical protein